MRQSFAGWIAVGIAVSGFGASVMEAQQIQVSPANRTISMTATETAERRADVATLHIGYHVYAADSAGAYGEAARLSNAIAAALAGAGVAKESIASQSQSTGASQEYSNMSLTADERARRRFEAGQSWTVKTTPEAVAKVLGEAVAAGANESGQIEWSLADEASLTGEAGVRALAHAQQQAAQMAKALGAGVGKLLYASNQVELMRPMPMIRAMALGGIAEKAAPTLSLSPPLVTRTATVEAVFAVE